MTLQEAADHLDIPKKRLWRAIKSGLLDAQKVQTGNRWEYRVSPEALESYCQDAALDDVEWNDLTDLERDGTERNGTFQEPRNGTERHGPERSTPGMERNDPTGTMNNGRNINSPPAEVYIELIDRLSRSERRSVELELQLRQSQRLLTENAESIQEREAQAKQVEAQLKVVEDAKQAEIERLNVELENTRQQLVEATSKKPSGFFSWLGLRKKRMSTENTTEDKAV